MTTLIYVHGFGSSSQGESALLFKKYSEKNKLNFMGFDYSVEDIQNPEIILENLKKFAKSKKDIIFVGSSLGGFFSNFIALEMECPTVLINPSLHPETSLAKYGLIESTLEKYKILKNNIKFRQIQRTVICGNQDNVVDPNKNGRLLDGKIINIDMSHRIDSDKMQFIFNEVLDLSRNIIDINSDYN